MAIRAILFDLDGTLVQTREASWQLFEETNREFALGIDSRDAFFGMFRKNFFRSLAERCADPERFAQVKGHFIGLLRSRYTPPLVPGMADVVRALAERFTLVVLSTNTTETIRRILGEAGLAHCFAHVFAGDVEPDKTVSMRRFLGDGGYRLGRRCSPEYDEAGPSRFEAGDEVLLITDTVGDVNEAQAAGVRAIGVAWGMHGEAELRAAGAERVALWPQELCAWILPEADAPCSPTACACGGHPVQTKTADLRAAVPAHELIRAAAEIRYRRRKDGAVRAVHAPGDACGGGVPARARAAPVDALLLATLKRIRRSAPDAVRTL